MENLASATSTEQPPSGTCQGDPPLISVKTWQDAKELFAKHLTPVRFTPKGWPVYSQADIDALVSKLKLRLPEDF
jgi:hypothetical protein